MIEEILDTSRYDRPMRKREIIEKQTLRRGMNVQSVNTEYELLILEVLLDIRDLLLEMKNSPTGT
jgi:hypothetical protein